MVKALTKRVHLDGGALFQSGLHLRPLDTLHAQAAQFKEEELAAVGAAGVDAGAL